MRRAHDGKQSRRRGRDLSPVHRRQGLDEMEEAPMTEPDLKCISLYEEGGRMAWACYDESNNEILMDDIISQSDDPEAVILGFMNVLKPNLILIGAKTASNFVLLNFLTRCNHEGFLELHENNNVNGNVGIPYKILKSSAFDLKQCNALILTKLRILSLFRTQKVMAAADRTNYYDTLKIVQESSKCSDQYGGVKVDDCLSSTYHSMASIIDFDSPILIRALGALLNYLQSTIFRMEEGSTITVNNISYQMSQRFMRIDQNAMSALHIFHTERHPVMAKGQSHTKEGFSLFTLLDRTKSQRGRQYLKDLMLRPLLDPQEIRKRQDVIALFVSSERSSSFMTSLENLLSRVGAVEKIILRMQKCHSNAMDLIRLFRTLEAAVEICGIIENDLKAIVSHNYSSEVVISMHDTISMQTTSSSELEWVFKLLEQCHMMILVDLLKRITSIVDMEATALKKDTVVIQFGFHEALDSAKDAFDRLDETLSAVGIEVLNKYPSLKQLKVIFLPQVGFLVSIDRRQHRHSLTTNKYPDLPQEMEFIFMQGDEAFFKTPEMRQLDDEVGDLDAYIKDTEAMIVNELEEDILECETELRSTFEALGELDCIMSLASVARDFGYTRPEINDAAGGYEIINGRHPLQELITDDDYIPNSIFINDQRRINIVTGPNFSGKSCFMRQVGVLVYMAHLGSFIPCEKAIISITDQILTQITCAETCAVPQSSFQRDLTRMSSILRRCTPHSLILIDEFGKGTAPASGISVLAAAIRKLMSSGSKVVCTTHFLEIFSLRLLEDGHRGVQVLQMMVHLPENDEEDAIPLFQLIDGISKKSAGLVCAKMAGVTNQVIKRAQKIIDSMNNGETVSSIPSHFNANSVFQSPTRSVLRFFIEGGAWIDATEQDTFMLKQYIIEM